MKKVQAIVIFFAVTFAFSSAQSKLVDTLACKSLEVTMEILNKELDGDQIKSDKLLKTKYENGECGTIKLNIQPGITVHVHYIRENEDALYAIVEGRGWDGVFYAVIIYLKEKKRGVQT